MAEFAASLLVSGISSHGEDFYKYDAVEADEMGGYLEQPHRLLSLVS